MIDKLFKKRISQKKGFTIIETMIAVALFVVVVMTGMDALLNANRIQQKSQDMRSVLDNLNFIMEDMSRNIRTGYNIHCVNDGNFSVVNLNISQSCSTGGAIAFEYAYGDTNNVSDQWVYKIESLDGGVTFNISKSTDSGATWVQLNPPEVLINSVSSFSVLGAEPPTGDSQQPLVTIRLAGKIVLRNNVISPFSLQTSVAQRLVDSDSLSIAGGTDQVWVEDTLPAGASPNFDGGDSWNWVSVNPAPFSGTLAHKSNNFAGEHQHYFENVTSPLAVSVGDTMVAYVYLDSINTPSEIMLQWNVGGSWEHRAYWGANTIAWGTDGTDSRRYMGNLPSTGQWVRLEVPASQVGLEGVSVSGIAFTLYGGMATWDHIGKNP